MRHRRGEGKRGWEEDGHRTGRGGEGRRRAAAAASVGEQVRGDAATWSGKRSALRSARREGMGCGLWPVAPGWPAVRASRRGRLICGAFWRGMACSAALLSRPAWQAQHCSSAWLVAVQHYTP